MARTLRSTTLSGAYRATPGLSLPAGWRGPHSDSRTLQVNYSERTVRVTLRLLVIALLAGLGLALAVVALAIPVEALVNHGASSKANSLPDITAPLSERSVVYAADGSVLATLHAAENRSPVSITQVPPQVINAVLDTEDARFWTHGGVDLKSTVRALASNVKSGAVAQGGSTITQQLVKIAFLTPQKHLDRKVKEAVIAMRLEKKYTKSQILEAYLNTVYFGNGAYGVQAAAETYFNKSAQQLTPVQGAFLAGMIRDPLGYDPILNPQDSKARRDFVLDRMVTQGHLATPDATALKATPIPSSLTPPLHSSDTRDDYFVEQVKQILLNQSTTLGNSYSERYNALFQGGLKIYTTLDPRLQSLAEQKVAAGVPGNSQGFTAALASIEPSTGKVRAIVGGPGFDTYKFDLATQALRQPGSGFKLFTLLAAYEAGYGPYDTIDGSSPCAINFPGDPDLLKQPVHNSEGDSAGALSLTSATAGSVNCAFIRLGHEVGLPKVIEMAHRLGLKEDFKPYPTLIIGAQETTVLEMAGAYATLADDGVYHQPTFIDHIDDRNGKTIFRSNPVGKRVLDPQISEMAVQTLRAVVQYGTGTAANLYDRQVAGKTGTTEQNTDAWFNGFAPQLATSVWMGDPKGRTPMYDVGGVTVFGGTYPARIWAAYTEAAMTGQPDVAFPTPDSSRIPGGRYIDSAQLQQDTGYVYKPPASVPSTVAKPKQTTTSTPGSSVPGSVPSTVPGSTPPTSTRPPGPGSTVPTPTTVKH
jgi:penicillin-binding protein 1A